MGQYMAPEELKKFQRKGQKTAEDNSYSKNDKTAEGSMALG